MIVCKLMPALKEAMEQRQKAGARATRMNVPRKMDSGLSDQYEHDDHDINESQNSQSNGKANPDEMKNLNIG